MPDKPKRRKNNKNKKKNKNNNKNNVSISNNESNDAGNTDFCDNENETKDDSCEKTQSVADISKTLPFADCEKSPDKLVSESKAMAVTKCENTPIEFEKVPSKLGNNIISSDIEQFNSVQSDINSNIKNLPTSKDTIINKNNNIKSELSETLIINSNSEKDQDQNYLCILNDPEAHNLQQSKTECPNYVVESPDLKKKSKSKLNSGIKSKSVDNDESPTIVEITEDTNIQCESDTSVGLVENSNIIITDAESDVEWEKTDELSETIKSKNLAVEAFSVTTIPLQIAQCEETKSLSSDQEKSLRCYLKSLNLPTSPSSLNTLEMRTEIEQIINREIKQRLRKKGFGEDMFLQRGTVPRGLDVIDEEGSSESSATSRRHSYLSEKKSDSEDLEDDVFENKQIVAFKPNTSKNRKLIPQECILVDAKLKEPEISEACGGWSLKTIEKVTGAEVVYLTDTSSSTSSLYDIADDIENDEISDTSIRIITPTIEVTDTEKFLNNIFIVEDTENINKNQTHTDCLENKDHDNVKKLNQNQQQPENLVGKNAHEIVILSTEDIKTNLTVKDATETKPETKPIIENVSQPVEQTIKTITDKNENSPNKNDLNTYDLEMKVLKCELNDAINNLIKEVSSDSDTPENNKDVYTRQDSSSSVCSSQSTAKYNPNYSSLNDVSNIMHEDTTGSITNFNSRSDDAQHNDLTSHVKEVFKCVTGISAQSKIKNTNTKEPLPLRDLCVKRIASFPFGNKILEELAHVSEQLQSMSVLALQSRESSQKINEKIHENNAEKLPNKMPYFPLPDLSTIDKIFLSTKDHENVPPPVHPRNSSLKKSQEDKHWTAIPTATDPVYVCLSPSQKSLMEKTKTVINKEEASQLIDTHKKFIDRRGYNEKLVENIEENPIIPFKSQTGSRLLALIRDPTVTNNISISSSSKNNFKSLESIPKLNYPDNNDYSEGISDNLMKYSKSFKPIPPPRHRKFSSSFYESDESSDFTDNSFRSIRSEKKVFHYSTGNLNKEIENDVSSIQNMHRYYSNMRDSYSQHDYPRRPSLPKDLCEQQMEYIRQKEKEVEEEIRRLEQEKVKFPEKTGPRAPLIEDKIFNNSKSFKKDILLSDTKSSKVEKGKLSSLFSKSQEELLREKMYSEYMNEMAQRQQRRHQKFIKITHPSTSSGNKNISKSMPVLDVLESKVNNRIEKEFICKARERWHKLGIEDPETEDENELNKDIYREPKVIEHKIKVIQAGEEKDLTKLPSHLQEFVNFAARTKEQESTRTGESDPEREPAHVVVFCAVIILVLAVGKFVWRLFQNKR